MMKTGNDESAPMVARICGRRKGQIRRFLWRTRTRCHNLPCMNRSFAMILTVVLLAGCAGGRPRAPAADPPREIRLHSAFAGEKDLLRQRVFATAPRAMATITLAVDAPVDPAHAPLPENAAEQLVFHHCYRTLTRVDGDGVVRPDLAAGWTSYDGGRRWEIRLDPGARFWDGSPVTAAAVLASWSATAYRTSSTPSAPNPLRWLDGRSRNLDAPDPRTLRIILAEPAPDLPAVLAHPALAVRSLRDPASGWPLGTGPCRPASGSGALDLVPVRPQAAAWDTLRLVTGPDAAAGADLALAPASAVGDGAPGTRITLPFSTLYLLVCPPADLGATENERERWTTDLDLRGWAAEIAGEAAAAPAPWSFFTPAGRLCPYLILPVAEWDPSSFDWPGRTAARDRDLVLCPAGDAAAKALAARLADHAARPLYPGKPSTGRGPLTPPLPPAGGLRPQALAIEAPEFEAALQAGRAGAYVLPVPRWTGGACRELAAILGRARWLQAIADTTAGTDRALPQNARALRPRDYTDLPQAERVALRLERGRVLMPLLAVRPQLRARPDLAGLAVDGLGNIDLTRMGRR